MKKCSLRCGREDTPTAAGIVVAIAAELSWEGSVERVPAGSETGRHPRQTHMTLATAAARELGYEPAGTTLELIADEIRWIKSGLTAG